MADSARMGVGIATTDYVAQYSDPITVTSGAEVRVEHEDDEWPGWWWCVAGDGRGGWVPRELLAPPPAPGSVSRVGAGYTARELTVRQGTRLEMLEARAGWLFVRDPGGATGWVPASHVAAGPSAT